MLCHFGIWFMIKMTTMSFRDVGDGWAEWAIPYTGFNRTVLQCLALYQSKGKIVPPQITSYPPSFW